MDKQAQEKLVAELAAERDSLNGRAAEKEKTAAGKEGEEKSVLEKEAKTLRAQADVVGQRWMDLMEDAMHDDDRDGGS
jgi:hypothetical protein